MIAFIIRRLIGAVIVMLTVALVAFVLFNFIGDPVNSMVGQEVSQQDREALRQQLGLNDPIPVRYAHFVWNAAHGDFGISYQYARPVSQLLLERLPATLELTGVAGIMAVLLGIPIGVYSAIRRESWLAKLFLTGSLIGISLPTFVVGTFLILIFSVILGWLPSFGRGTTVAFGWWTTGLLTPDGRLALIMPAITIMLFQLTLISRLVRAEMLEVLRSDYIKFVRARGLSDRALYFGHALKNSLIPAVTIIGLQFGAAIAFAVITETVFQWPGMGLLIIQAIGFADVPVMAAYLVLIAFIFVVINLIVDLLYFVLDPRLKIEGRTAGGHA